MFDIKEKTVQEIQKAMDTKKVTAKELVLAYFARIVEVDSCKNGLNSILELNSDAIFIAEELDKERSKGKVRSLLHGIPIMLKDNINTFDKMHTSAGSLALADNFTPYDAKLVERLRVAGAIILGKTNMTEFANCFSKNLPNGYSSYGGQVISPYNIDADPLGSSTGSAVAVSANLCSAAIGTDSMLCLLMYSIKNS